jgi:isoquinoline 1-oxidoreductase subunit alpha
LIDASEETGSRSGVVLNVNGRERRLNVDEDEPLLFVLRDALGLKGTKFGCLIGACGACTVLVDGAATRSCIVPATAIGAAKVETIESLPASHALIRAWIAEQVPQCGFCQPGMVMATAALLKEKPRPSDQDIDETITNICRCGTYTRIRRAIRLATGQSKSGEAA